MNHALSILGVKQGKINNPESNVGERGPPRLLKSKRLRPGSRRIRGSVTNELGTSWNANCLVSKKPFFKLQETTMSVESLEDLFLHELKDIYDGEKRILKALPKMAKAATAPELQAAFEEHQEETEQQIARLEEVFELLEKPARGKKCMGIQGLLEEGAELMKEDAMPPVMDAGLIAAAQKVEHYEIASYGTLATYAKILGLRQVGELLKQTLGEEKETDKKLTKLASEINFEAEMASEEA